jgi:hypothetical protein
MRTARLGSFELDFSHGQLLVYDVSVASPECEWTDEHTAQGFARRESALCLGTLLQDGTARITVFHGPWTRQQEYMRVIANPFSSPTGRIVVCGLMEMYIAHLVQLRPGSYRLYSCQYLEDSRDDHEVIDLFFLPEEHLSSQSEIILADERLSPPSKLVEQASEMRV